MTRFLAILALVALVAAPALADRVGPKPVRPVRGVWVLFDDDCTDSYSLDGAGLAPPAGTDPGTGGLGSTSSWNSLAEAYNLQANLGAPAQVSGAADGLCDATPWTIAGAITTGAAQDLYIGPIKLPASGAYLISDMDAVGISYDYSWVIELPWDTATGYTVATTANTNSLNVLVYNVGPLDNTSTIVQTSDEMAFPAVDHYLFIDLNDAASWQINLGLFPYRTDFHGND